MNFSKLLEPAELCGMRVRNRLVLTPLQTRAADEAGRVTPELIEYYRERLQPGPGLVVVQQTFAWPSVKLERGLALWDDEFVPGMTRLADALHQAGARAFLQLGGAGSRRSGEGGPVAPSPVAGSWNLKVPRELTRSELMEYLDCYAAAGERLYRAGFDGFSLQGTAGKFLAQFLSPYSNRRGDEFGGSAAGRVRYPLMVIQAIRARTRPDFPVILRVNACDAMEGGLSLEEGIEQAALLCEGGVDALLFGGGGQERLWLGAPSYMMEDAPLLPWAVRYKRALPHVPLIFGGLVHDPHLAERILEEGAADFIAVMRPLLADPEYVRKVEENRPADIHACVGCMNCQTWERRPRLAARGVACTVNPLVFHARPVARAQNPRRVLVAGGGPAGLRAAALLAHSGHRVELHERTARLGGQWLAASAPKSHDRYKTLIPDLEREVRAAGVAVRLESTVDRALVERLRSDVVVAATGATPRPLTVDGTADRPPTFFGLDVLRGADVPGKRIVVVGGRYIGIEAACQLAEQGREVSLVEINDLAVGTVPRVRSLLFRRLVEAGVRLYPRSAVFRITSRQVEIAHGGALFFLDADAVVAAVGTVPHNPLPDELRGLPVDLRLIGDCTRIGDALDAMLDAVELCDALAEPIRASGDADQPWKA